jgi:hypothetical protein
MRICFIALICTLSFTHLQARYLIAGVKLGGGMLINGNTPYAPSPELTGTGGFELGAMIGKHLGVMTGIYKSPYKFTIYDDGYILAYQSLDYLNIPVSCRFLWGKGRKVKLYLQLGADFCLLQNAHFTHHYDGPYGNYKTHDTDNKGDFRNMSIRVVGGVGFIWRVASGVHFMAGAEMAGGQNVVKNESYNGYSKSIQGIPADMVLGCLELKIGVEFHFAYSRSKLNEN